MAVASSAGARDPVKNLCEEATCSVCLKYFKDPVLTECGHNFCRTCLTRCWRKSGTAEISCPQCRGKVLLKNLRLNRQLANFVELTKKLSLRRPRIEEGKEGICEQHQQPFKLFCKDHETSICVVCDKSKAHEHHKVIPLDEALETYEDQIWNLLENLKKEREKVLAYKADTEEESQGLPQTKREKKKTVAAFRKMHQFLEEQEKLLLSQMEEAEKEISAKRMDHLAKLSVELSSIEDLIREVEEKSQQPARELLKDIGSFLQRYEEKEEFENPVAFPPDLKWKIWYFHDMTPFLEGVMKQFKDTLESGLQEKKAKVTLDPETAHPSLALSEYHRTVLVGEKPQALPDNPKRFKKCPYVLGHKGFTGGRHFWNVIVGSEESWAIGVARKSVGRKGFILNSPKGGIWDMGKWGDAYRASYPSANTVLSLRNEPKRIRVTLNCEGGRVAFYDADTADLIFEYPPASFSGETLLPFFYVDAEGCLTLCP